MEQSVHLKIQPPTPNETNNEQDFFVTRIGEDEENTTENEVLRRTSNVSPFQFNNGPLSPGILSGTETPIPDVNLYQHKKTLAQGMMDLALLSANANQLRYVLESYARHPYYYASLTFIIISLLFQIAVGIGLIWNSRYDVKDKKEICIADKINNFTIIGIFIVTVVNVFISAFGVADLPPDNQNN